MKLLRLHNKNILSLFAFVLISVLSSCQQEVNKLRELETKISYFEDLGHLHPINEIKNLNLTFRIGFDSLTNFKIKINNQLIHKFSCKTNSSIDCCMIEEGPLKARIADFSIPHDMFKSGDTITIETDDEFIQIELNDKMKKYNSIRVNRNAQKNIYSLSFQNSNKVEFLE